MLTFLPDPKNRFGVALVNYKEKPMNIKPMLPILGAAIAISIMACGGGGNKGVETADLPSWYAAGQNSSERPTIWKNGNVVKTLNNYGIFYDIDVSGGAARAAGEMGELPIYYNGQTDSMVTLNTTFGYVNAMAVSGSTVWLAGYGGEIGRVWSGGGATIYTFGASSYYHLPYAISVNDGVVWTAGDDEDGDASLCRNGEYIDSLENGVFNGVHASSAGVFVCGEADGRPVWAKLDGYSGYLGTGYGEAWDVAVSGGNVYIAGYDGNGGKIWRGTPNGTSYSPFITFGRYDIVGRLRVVGSDVYSLVHNESSGTFRIYKNDKLGYTFPSGAWPQRFYFAD
jgi:hypothetical protein